MNITNKRDLKTVTKKAVHATININKSGIKKRTCDCFRERERWKLISGKVTKFLVHFPVIAVL